MEVWKPVPSAPDYEVSNHGRVRRATAKTGTRAGKLLSPQRRGKAGRYVGVDLRIGLEPMGTVRLASAA
jgi:hypothetical protein